MKPSQILKLICFIVPVMLYSQQKPQKPLSYPTTQKVPVTDTYHGVKVDDPYRWLEDDTSKATARWVEQQNLITFDYLDKIPYRKEIYNRLEKMYNYPKYGVPIKKGEYVFFFKNDGLQNQSVLYKQVGVTGKPEVFFDPNTLSKDGTIRLGLQAFSKNAHYWAFGLSKGGSDWNEVQIMDVKTRKILPETLRWIKVSGISWYKDGFYYSRYPQPKDTTKVLSATNEHHQVYYHKVGTPQSADELIFEDKANPLRFHFCSVTDDERFLILSVSDRSKGKDGNALYFRDLKNGGKTFIPLVTSFDDDFGVVDNDGDNLIIQTNQKAPKGKIIGINVQHPQKEQWKDLVPEKSESINFVTGSGGKIFINYSKDVTHKIFVFNRKGELENEVELPVPGTVGGFGGEPEDTKVFYTLTSFTYPPTIFEYDIPTKKSTLFRKTEVSFRPEDYETKQVFYKSKDGASIPMFIVHKKGIRLDGSNPTLLYGYGGFNVSLFPSFSPLRVVWLEMGGVFVQANLRGGGEYGEEWHAQGMKLKKQNVFDDFISAAEWLVKNSYTNPNKLAIQGGSNGGLLVGACMIQRPDLFKVALPAVGVMDMLRFHKFTIGWNWIADYGSSDVKEEFEAIYKYSPLHTLKQGVNYPATLITTADHDDRVVPAHSFKFAATLQEKQSREPSANPVMIRIATKSGHGASNTKKALEETADLYAFTLYNLGIQTLHYNNK